MSTAIAEREEQAAPPQTAAQRQKARLDAFMNAVEKRQDQIGTLLAESGVDPRLFLETCRRALMRDPELINTDPASFIQAALNCAADGLIPDGRKAAIVRYKSAAQYVPMYQGLLDIAYRSGNFQSIESHVVYEGDEFDYEMGDNPRIHHKRSLESSSTAIIGAYAIAKTVNGGVFREVMGKGDLQKVRAVSKASKGPNVDWPGEMARKAPIRRLWKFLPKTTAMDRVALHDDATYDQTALASANDQPRRLAPGFNPPPALAHQPAEDITPTVDTSEPEHEVIDAEVEDMVDDDDFPGGRPLQQAQEPRQEAEAAPSGVNTASQVLTTLSARLQAFRTQVSKAPSTREMQALWSRSAQLRNDIDAGDPDEVGTSAELETWFQETYAVKEAEEKAERSKGGAQ